jgi:outer membrane protein assembly factor BamB
MPSARHPVAFPFRCLLALMFGVAAVGSAPWRGVAARTTSESLAPDDSPAAVTAALERLRTTPRGEVCADASYGSRSYGTTCGTREFPAPAILAAPKPVWTLRPGWWGTWSPFLIGDVVLTGSCNNEDNKGLSALDAKTGRTLWRIGSICEEGNRAGTMGSVRFHGLSEHEVLMIHGREDGRPADVVVVDVRTGRFVRTLTPAKRGPTGVYPGVFTVLTQSTQEGTSHLNAFSADFSTLLWRHVGYHLACDKLDPHCRPVFSGAAVQDGVLYMSITTKDQPDPPTRQLHAFDLATGTLRWKHTAQPVVEHEQSARGLIEYRSDDGTPMVADGKVLIRLDGSLGPAGRREPPTSFAIRALDARTGATRWTTAPIARRLPREPGGDAAPPTQRLVHRLVAGRTLVVELAGPDFKALLGYRLEDGTLRWRRPVPTRAELTASSGGAFYLAERVEAENKDSRHYVFQGLDGETGTLLWTTMLPAHNVPFTLGWGSEDGSSGVAQGPSWRIGPDGAIYGVTLQGPYKLQ